MPKILEIAVGIQMERFVLGSSDRNIRDHLWWWSTYFGRNILNEIRRAIMTNRFFALIREFGKRISNDNKHYISIGWPYLIGKCRSIFLTYSH